MLRQSLTRVLQQLLLQRKQPPAVDTVQQYAVQAFHSGSHQCFSSSSSSSSSADAGSSQAANSCNAQQVHQYHAAAISAQQPHTAAAATGASVNSSQEPGQQQQQHLKQLLQHHDQAKQQPQQEIQQPRHHLHQQLVPGKQQQLVQTVLASTQADSMNATSSSSSLSLAGPNSGGGGDDALAISSFEEQYQQTLEHLHVGHTRNLSHLAQLFDPHAVLAAPDKGAAILEALMFGAAKLGDAALLSQLLRCMDAARIPLSSTGHTAVLHGLVRVGRTAKAVKWLKERVPQQLLTSSMIRNTVQPLLQQGHVVAAEDVVRWASSRAQQLQDTTTAEIGKRDGRPKAQESGDQWVPLLRDYHQQLPCMRLMVAAAKGTLGAVQAEWAAIQQEQQQLLGEQQQHGAQVWCRHHPHLLGVPVWCSYVSALGQIGKKDPTSVHTLMQGAIEQLADVYHTTAWGVWAHTATAWQQRQEHSATQQQQTTSSSSVQQQDQQVVLQEQQHAALQVWQQVVQQLPQLTWQDLDPARVLPLQAAVGVRQEERDLLRRAFDAALHMAATQLDAAWMDQLLKLASLLRIFPKSWGFDALLNLRVWEGAPPETIEDMLSEVTGWGIAPTLSHYEHLMEAYALHRDLPAAIHVLDRMQAAGHTPLLRTYNRLLHGVSLNGDVAAASRVFMRLRAQGLLPDQQTMRALFKCVRLYAVGVRVDTARKLAQAKPGDRESIKTLLSQRSGLFTAAYSQLATWQGEMVAAGLKHNSKSMHQLLAALERLGAVNDCLHLAELHEEMKPGTYTAHRFALQAASRKRDAHGAGTSAKLALKLASGQEGLQRQDYTALIAANFWLQHDHEQLIQTVKDMVKAGYDLDESVLLQLLHVYCTSGMWGEALQVLDDLAAGRIRLGTAEASSSNQQQGAHSRVEQWSPANQQKAQGAAVAASSSTGQQWKARQYGDLSDQDDTRGQKQLAQDKLWHVVMRKLWERRASDSLLNEFLSRMTNEQLQRFKVLYNLRPLPDAAGYTMQPVEDWQVQAPEHEQQGQRHTGTVEVDIQRPLHLV